MPNQNLTARVACASCGSGILLLCALAPIVRRSKRNLWRGKEHLVSGELIYVNADPATKKSAPLPELLREKIIRYERVPAESAQAKP
jgi:hypothetical protein